MSAKTLPRVVYDKQSDSLYIVLSEGLEEGFIELAPNTRSLGSCVRARTGATHTSRSRKKKIFYDFDRRRSLQECFGCMSCSR